MPIGWFITPYKRDLADTAPSRYCAMQDADSVIRLDDGDWQETEVLHSGRIGKAIVKVRASAATLADIATMFLRLPKNALDDPLSDLSPAQRTAVRDELEDMGYTLAEIQTRFGNRIQDFTLGDVIRFAASRRQKPRFDGANIICDGVVQACRDVNDVHQTCFGDVDWTRIKSIRDTLLAEYDATLQTIRLSQRLPNLPKHERAAILALCGRAGYAFDKIKPDTFPTTGVLDNFNRADGDDGANWNSTFWGDGSPAIVSNTVWASTSASAYWSPATYGPDSEVFETIVTKQSSVRIYLFLRCVNPGASTLDCYTSVFEVSAGTDFFQIRRIDNGATTTLGANMSQEVTNGDSYGLEMIGSTLTQYYKTAGSWASLGTRTDSTYTAAGNIAHGIYNNVYRGDDFGGGTVVTVLPFKQKIISQAVNRASTY